MHNPVYVELRNRAEISVGGAEGHKFLQGLVTNDLNLLKSQSIIYACLLTAHGKFLFDFFIRKNAETYLIDCEGGDRASALLKKLKMYKLRADVTLTLNDTLNVYQIFNGTHDKAYKDPRNDVCGFRSYTEPTDIQKVDFNTWDEHRIRNEIPDGSRDFIVEKSYIHEGRLDELNAVSYTKGCYVGQELVSRMHHRGLTKKILKYVEITDDTDQSNLRSSCNGIGLVVTKI
ncbi:MAG: glycine cleavage protein T [Alphaproteobacteria bacterium]|nr:MAG: glycine cleavage protein T [Alphaproteobacteria bacterium]